MIEYSKIILPPFTMSVLDFLLDFSSVWCLIVYFGHPPPKRKKSKNQKDLGLGFDKTRQPVI